MKFCLGFSSVDLWENIWILIHIYILALIEKKIAVLCKLNVLLYEVFIFWQFNVFTTDENGGFSKWKLNWRAAVSIVSLSFSFMINLMLLYHCDKFDGAAADAISKGQFAISGGLSSASLRFVIIKEKPLGDLFVFPRCFSSNMCRSWMWQPVFQALAIVIRIEWPMYSDIFVLPIPNSNCRNGKIFRFSLLQPFCSHYYLYIYGLRCRSFSVVVWCCFLQSFKLSLWLSEQKILVEGLLFSLVRLFNWNQYLHIL